MLLNKTESTKTLAAEAADPKSSADRLAEIFEAVSGRHFGRLKVYVALASNPGSPPETLDELAGHLDARVFLEVAANPATPVEALRRIWTWRGIEAGYGRKEVALGLRLASNPSAPLEEMYESVSAEGVNGLQWFLECLVQNPAASLNLVARLLVEHPWIRVSEASANMDEKVRLAVRLRHEVDSPEELVSMVSAVC